MEAESWASLLKELRHDDSERGKDQGVESGQFEREYESPRRDHLVPFS